jgi:glucan phosphoethanolaminetransferase (alkaline phosphatase superfamily)
MNPEPAWDAFIAGGITKKEFWQAYRANLELVMKEVEKMKNELKGKIVLTSDHGDALGEHGIFVHPPNVRIEELVKVPWVVIKDRVKYVSEKKEIEGRVKKALTKLERAEWN